MATTAVSPKRTVRKSARKKKAVGLNKAAKKNYAAGYNAFKEYKGQQCDDGTCQQLDITLNKKHLGVIRCTDKGWRITGVPQGLVNAIGDEIFHWYE